MNRQTVTGKNATVASRWALPRTAAAIVTMLAVGGCAGFGGERLTGEQRLSAYQASAGEPVNSFSILGGIDSWTELGDRYLAVSASANDVYLLELSFPCPELTSAFGIDIRRTGARVAAGFDSVIVRDTSGFGERSCPISRIWPVDSDALDEALEASGPANMIESEPVR